jgi:hypothetical protein
MLRLTHTRFQNGQTGAGRFPPRALPEIELQFVESGRQVVGGADDRFGNCPAENGDGGTAHRQLGEKTGAQG